MAEKPMENSIVMLEIEQMQRLDVMARAIGASRSELIRSAVSDYLRRYS